MEGQIYALAIHYQLVKQIVRRAKARVRRKIDTAPFTPYAALEDTNHRSGPMGK